MTPTLTRMHSPVRYLQFVLGSTVALAVTACGAGTVPGPGPGPSLASSAPATSPTTPTPSDRPVDMPDFLQVQPLEGDFADFANVYTDGSAESARAVDYALLDLGPFAGQLLDEPDQDVRVAVGAPPQSFTTGQDLEAEPLDVVPDGLYDAAEDRDARTVAVSVAERAGTESDDPDDAVMVAAMTLELVSFGALDDAYVKGPSYYTDTAEWQDFAGTLTEEVWELMSEMLQYEDQDLAGAIFRYGGTAFVYSNGLPSEEERKQFIGQAMTAESVDAETQYYNGELLFDFFTKLQDTAERETGITPSLQTAPETQTPPTPEAPAEPTEPEESMGEAIAASRPSRVVSDYGLVRHTSPTGPAVAGGAAARGRAASTLALRA